MLCLNSEPISTRQIAREQNLSANYLESILNTLRNADIIESIKGVKGGYRLKVDPNQFSVEEAIKILEKENENNLISIDCMQEIIKEEVYDRLDHVIHTYLQSITLSQLANEDIDVI